MDWVCIGQGSTPSSFNFANPSSSIIEAHVGTIMANVNAVNHGDSDGSWIHRTDQYMVRFVTDGAVAQGNSDNCIWGYSARNFRRVTRFPGGNRILFDIYAIGRNLQSVNLDRWELYRLNRNLSHTFNSGAAGGSSVNVMGTPTGSSSGSGGNTPPPIGGGGHCEYVGGVLMCTDVP